MTSERAGCKRPYDELAAAAAAAAVATAASEGLPFVRSDNSSGFKGVALSSKFNQSKPFVVLKAGSERQYLGYFLTAEEAALAYSRHIGKAAALAMQEEASKEDYCLMSAAEVEQAAAQEGLWLLEDQTSSTGYRGVAFLSDCPRRPYAVRSVGKRWLGYFTTKQEAALAYARHLGRGWFQAELAKAVKAVEAAEAITAAKAVRAKAKAVKAVEAAEAITAAKAVRAKAKAVEAARPQAMAAKAVKRIESKAACKREEKARFKTWAQEQQKQVQERQREMLRRAGEEQKRLFREAAERLQQQQQHQQQQHAAAPTAAASGDVGISATMTIDELVMHVLGNAHCPHRCLDVELGAPRETARKQYLALVLRLHPDKTGHPRAKEAFAAVEKSYQAFR